MSENHQLQIVRSMRNCLLDISNLLSWPSFHPVEMQTTWFLIVGCVIALCGTVTVRNERQKLLWILLHLIQGVLSSYFILIINSSFFFFDSKRRPTIRLKESLSSRVIVNFLPIFLRIDFVTRALYMRLWSMLSKRQNALIGLPLSEYNVLLIHAKPNTLAGEE